MALISERSGQFRVQIRKKDINLYRTFQKESDAKLWAAYKEECIDLIEAFDPPLNEIITLQDAIELKIRKMQDENSNRKEINDYKILCKIFNKFCPLPINEITYSDLLKHFQELLDIPISHGGTGKNDGTGVKKLPSFQTIFRKFAYLSTVYQNLINDGVELENVALKAAQYYRQKNK